MEPVLRQSMSANKLANIDVSQLDKVNAITNKSGDSVLMNGLCQQDRLYLEALMDEDSNDSGDEEAHASQAIRTNGSVWSPMVQKPVVLNKRKRLKKMRSSYAITLSLEDISYIRPSWGLSKGIKRIEVNKNKNKKQSVATKRLKAQPAATSAAASKESADNKSAGSKPTPTDQKEKRNSAYYLFLVGLAAVVTILIASSKSIEQYRAERKILSDRAQLDARGRRLKIFKPTAGSQLGPLFNVYLAQGIPTDLKYKECSCDNYHEALESYLNSVSGQVNQKRRKQDETGGQCFACLDWAERANLQIYTELRGAPGEPASYCYNIKWQSYDSLATPLVDCFDFDRDQWFGLGDLQWPADSWPLNRLQFQASKLITNLTGEFQPAARARVPTTANGDTVAPQQPLQQTPANRSSLRFGSLVELSLINSAGIQVTDLRSDFQASIRTNNNPRSGANQLCLAAQCADKCGSTWAKADKLPRFRYENNILQYSVCTDVNWRNLVDKSFKRRGELREVASRPAAGTSAKLSLEREDRQLNELVDSVEARQVSSPSPSSPATTSQQAGNKPNKPERIGLIERTIFATSLEYMTTLDGQTMRELADQIVKLNLKTSPILIMDTRWQTYVGSFKLNAALFPKAKLLFEILHNKGFKIGLTVKPYIDTAIGINSINQLLEAGRLVTTSDYSASASFSARSTAASQAEKNIEFESTSEPVVDFDEIIDFKHYLIRRRSFFSFRNETILVEQEASRRSSMAERTALSFKCREARDGYCVLVDLTQERNRVWLTEAIKRSTFLSQEADAILVGGAHPNNFLWTDDYRMGLARLVDSLFQDEKLFAIPQWTGNYRYIQLAPRQRSWTGLRSTVNSVLNLGMTGWSLVHPGSVWGDLRRQNDVGDLSRLISLNDTVAPLAQGLAYDEDAENKSEEELITRWLQVAIFMPIFQMNDLAPVEKYKLGDQLQSLVKIRKLHIVSELKKHLPQTDLVISSGANSKPSVGNVEPVLEAGKQMPLVRPVWASQDPAGESIISGQFQIGPDIMVAPILEEGQRQKDIYLPAGYWRDELRQTNIRGAKWLRNYPIELNEIAWFTRARR